jgi:hypothetical protein
VGSWEADQRWTICMSALEKIHGYLCVREVSRFFYTYHPYIHKNHTINHFGEADALMSNLLKLLHSSTNTGRMLPAAEREEGLREGKRSWYPELWRFSGYLARLPQPR